MENWKPVVNFEGFYEISDQARVRSLHDGRKFKAGHVMSPKLGKWGYFYVNLYRNGKFSKTLKIHRMVATAFVPNPNNKPEVNHKDGNKQNNLPTNLEWVTESENVIHAFATGLHSGDKMRGEKNGFAKLTENNVKEIFQLRAEGRTQQCLADQFGVSRGHISVLLSGKVCWKHLTIPCRRSRRSPARPQ